VQENKNKTIAKMLSAFSCSKFRNFNQKISQKFKEAETSSIFQIISLNVFLSFRTCFGISIHKREAETSSA